MNRSLFKFGVIGYIFVLIGSLAFYCISYRSFSELNFIFLAPLLVGIFILLYKSNGLYHRSKRTIVILDFLYVMTIIIILSINIPHLIAVGLAIFVGVLGGLLLLKYTFGKYY